MQAQIVVILSILSLVLGTIDHVHPTYDWKTLEMFYGRTLFISESTTLSIPLDAHLHCGVVSGKKCMFPGYILQAKDHVDYRFDIQSPFYMFVDNFTITRDNSGDVVYVKLLTTVSKVKMLNVGCNKLAPMLNLPFGTKLYHDKDRQLEVEGRAVPCTNRRYFIEFCPSGPNDFCFYDVLRIFDLGTFKGRKGRANVFLSLKDEL